MAQINFKVCRRKEKAKKRQINRFLNYHKKQKKKKIFRERDKVATFKIANSYKKVKWKSPSIKHYKNRNINSFGKYILKKTICRRYGIEEDLFDFEAYIDYELSLEENLHHLKDNYFSPKLKGCREL